MSASAPPTGMPTTDKIDGAVLKVAGVVVLGAIMSILDITVVNVALPHFQTDLAPAGADPLPYATVAWTVTAYTLALATVIPLTGWAADRFGTKRLYLAALVLFVAGSTLCAFAPTIETLIAFRVIQGLGGGMLMPLGMTIMTRAAGPERMGRLMAILGVPMLLGPIAGPILGGWLIDNAHWLGRPSWTWIFLINLPIGAAALVYAWVVLPKDQNEPSESLDLIGLLLMSPGLAALLYGVSSIAEGRGEVSTTSIVATVAGALMIAAFAWWSRKPEHPLLDFTLFRDRNFTVASATMFLFAAAFFGGLLLVPTYFQQARGEDTFTAGLLIAPQGLGAMLTMPIAGALADRIPVGRIVPIGVALITGGMFAMTQIDDTTSYWGFIIPVLFIMGLGMGATMMPLMTAALKTLRAHQVARGSTSLNIIQQVASSVGVAISSVLLTNAITARPLIEQSQGFADASDGVTDPGAIEQLLGRFPEVASVVSGITDPSQWGPAIADAVSHQLGEAFASTYWVPAILCALTLALSLLLPRKHEENKLAEGEDETPNAPVMMH